jgi:hypothetical protein
MTTGVRTLIYPVRDLAGAKALCSTLLGVEPYAVRDVGGRKLIASVRDVDDNVIGLLQNP